MRREVYGTFFALLNKYTGIVQQYSSWCNKMSRLYLTLYVGLKPFSRFD